MRVLLLLLSWPLLLGASPIEVRILVLGRVPAPLVDAVKQGLEAALPVRVTSVDHGRLPKAAWYAPRKRYRADKLLDHLATWLGDAPDGTRVLGLTAVDISTTKGRHRDWGIFGLANLAGPAAVVSTYRLRRKARDAGQIRFRVVSTAVHETGHTLGLPHCAEPRCVMQDAGGSIANTDGGTGLLEPGCTAQLRALLN